MSAQGTPSSQKWESAPRISELQEIIGTREQVLATIILQRSIRGMLVRSRIRAAFVVNVAAASGGPNVASPGKAASSRAAAGGPSRIKRASPGSPANPPRFRVGGASPKSPPKRPQNAPGGSRALCAPPPFQSAPSLSDLSGSVIGTREEVLATIRVQAVARRWLVQRETPRIARTPTIDSVPFVSSASAQALPTCRRSSMGEASESASAGGSASAGARSVPAASTTALAVSQTRDGPGSASPTVNPAVLRARGANQVRRAGTMASPNTSPSNMQRSAPGPQLGQGGPIKRSASTIGHSLEESAEDDASPRHVAIEMGEASAQEERPELLSGQNRSASEIGQQISPMPSSSSIPAAPAPPAAPAAPAAATRDAPLEPTSREEGAVALPRRMEVLTPNKGFCNNAAVTSRFTTLNFLPLALAEQLHPINKFVNCYFLVAGALQLISAITLTEGMPMIWLNVGVLFVQARPAARTACPHEPLRTTVRRRATIR